MKNLTASVETCVIVNNVPSDSGMGFFMQVFDSKGEYIAIDKDEYQLRVDSLEGTIKFNNEDRKELQDRGEKQLQELRQRLHNEQKAFDEYKKHGKEIAIRSLNALFMFLRANKRNKKTIGEAERLYQELNDPNGKFKFFFQQNDFIAGPQQVINTKNRDC